MTCSVCTAHALESLTITVPAQYDTLTVPDHIRNDCIGLDRTVGIEVAYRLEKSGFAKIDRTDFVNLKAPGKLLTLNITDASASSGEFTNARSLSVKAELFQDGKPFEWVIKSHAIRGDTEMCDMMEKNAVVIAQEIQQWLASTLHSKTLPATLDSAASVTDAAAKLRQLQSHTVWINSNVNYFPDTAKPQMIDDCRVESTIVSQAIATFSKDLTAKRLAQSDDAGKEDDVLRFSIVTIKGDGDDSTIEKRGMTLRAELLRDGNVIDTFNGIHSTERGGAFGQVLHTTCEALSNISDTMVNDTYQWYVNRGASTSTSSSATSESK